MDSARQRHRAGVSRWVLITATLIVPLLTGCSGYAANSIQPAQPEISCDDVLAQVLHREKTGDTSGAINLELDWLGSNCSASYDVFVEHISAKGMAKQLGPETCDSLTQYIGRESINLLRADGLCSDGIAEPPAKQPAKQPVVESQPGGGIAWNEATKFAGTTQRVCGPLASIGSSTDDVFLNLGRKHPDPKRFQIVIWDVGRVEYIPYGKTLCTSGKITLYKGVAQIELRSPTSVEIYE